MRTIKIIIHGETLPSWNKFYSGRHWSYRSAEKKKWHTLVYQELKKQKFTREKCIDYPIDIKITCYYIRQIDCDNIMAKLAIDGLKFFLLVDDDPRYVKSVTAISLKAKKKRTEIEISPYENFTGS